MDQELEKLETLWQARGIDPTVLRPNKAGTIIAETLPPADGQPVGLAGLPRIRLCDEGETPELRLGATLGEGGMGVVRLATQLPLGREVAVKTGRPETALELLREARSTGTLEHPNVVPVHALGQDGEGSPLLVMKKVDGVSWSELIRRPDHPVRAGDSRDPLEYHLDVLLQVCNAVSFAHSKGILHRDIKPDNVMVGRFGEVYLLDWGIAVAASDAAASLLPRARDVREVAGTPQYMAPEMAAGDGGRIDERSDVYLLGAVLHECITGQPRHAGTSLLAVLKAAYDSCPFDYGDAVPAELAAICNRATARDPQARFGGVDELRRAIARFLSHRASSALAAAASRRLQSLRELIEKRPHVPELERQIHVRFSECRLGFQEALRAWPQNLEAQRGLVQAIEQMATHQLARGDVGAAAALLREVEEPPPALERRLEALEQQLAQERGHIERLHAMERDMDLSVGRRTRVLLVAVMAVIYTVVPLAMALAQRRGWLTIPAWSLILDTGSYALLWIGAAWWARETLFKTAVNRQIMYSVGALALAMNATTVSAFVLDLPTSLTIMVLMPQAFILLSVLAATVDRRLLVAALSYLTGFLCAAAAQRWTHEIFAAANAAALIYIAVIWRPEGMCRTPSRS